jgi:hypothetical protein
LISISIWGKKDKDMDQKNIPINTNKNTHQSDPDVASNSPESQNRRDLVTKLGKFAIYAAPFTVMALNSQAASGSGPRRH